MLILRAGTGHVIIYGNIPISMDTLFEIFILILQLGFSNFSNSNFETYEELVIEDLLFLVSL